MEDIKLPIAEELNSSTIFHISERIPKSIDLVCPYCKNKVIARKGKIRRHHFSHSVNCSCDVSPETLLHDGAKHFIYNHLIEKKPFPIIFELNRIKDHAIQEVINSISALAITINSNSLFDTRNATHKLEHSFKHYIPDILSVFEGYDNDVVIWEVFVTHTDRNKLEFLIDNNISFIELIPIEDDINDYKFIVSNYNNIKILTYSYFVNQPFTKIHSIDETINNFINNIDYHLLYNNYHPNNVHMAYNISHCFHIEVLDNYNDKIDSASITTTKRISSIKQNFDNKYNTILIDNKYFLNSPIALLGSLLESLSTAGVLRVLLNNDNQVVGVKIVYSDLINNKLCHEYIKLKGKEFTYDDIIVSSCSGKRSDKGYPYLTASSEGHDGSYFVVSPHRQLCNIVQFFMRKMKVNYYIRKNLKGYQTVTGINIIGLTNEMALQDAVTHLFIERVTHLLKEQLKETRMRCLRELEFFKAEEADPEE